MADSECIFCKIANGRVSVPLLFEDEEFVAFRDLNPQAPVHVLVVPKNHYETIMDVPDANILGRGLRAVTLVATKLQLDRQGFRTVINCRDNGGQTVPHLHFHVLGGRFMQWPPG